MTTDRNAPIRLDVAAKLAFPDGGMTASGLRRERDRGTLRTMIVARKEFTTLADIDAMLAACRSSPVKPVRRPEEPAPQASPETAVNAAMALAKRIAAGGDITPKRAKR